MFQSSLFVRYQPKVLSVFFTIRLLSLSYYILSLPFHLSHPYFFPFVSNVTIIFLIFLFSFVLSLSAFFASAQSLFYSIIAVFSSNLPFHPILQNRWNCFSAKIISKFFCCKFCPKKYFLPHFGSAKNFWSQNLVQKDSKLLLVELCSKSFFSSFLVGKITWHGSHHRTILNND